MLKSRSTKVQGDKGLAAAIQYFIFNGYTVCIPLTDSQDYDLIVEKEGKMQRVQVKTATNKTKCAKGVFYLRISMRERNKVKTFSMLVFDFLFALTNNGDMFLIPTGHIRAENTICLGEKYQQYYVGTI